MNGLLGEFARLHHRDPERPLIHLPAAGRSLTADDLWRAHTAYASDLCGHGLRPGHLLVVAIGNRPASVSLLLAARALGVAVLAVDAGTTAPEIADLADRFGAAALVVPADNAPGVEGGRRLLAEGLELVFRTSTTPRPYDDTALLKLTSGSTGAPKAARTTDAHLIADSRQIVTAMGIGPDETQIAAIPLSHAYGLSVILVPLIIQGTPIVLRESFVPNQLAEDALAFDARTFPGVPFMFEHFVSHPPAGGWPGSLRRLVSAGARLPPDTVRAFHDRFGVKIHSFYGASESGGISYDASDEVDGDDTVGHPLPGVTISFRPDPLTPPGTGRVHVRSSGVAAGYVGGASEEFCDGGFLTGDYGRFDTAGRLTLTGRVSSFINVAGRKVQPAEVEDVLRRMPGVRDVRVLGTADAQRGEQVVACLVADGAAAGTLTTMSVRRFCSSRLAPHKIPRAVIVLDAIPLNARGKTDRRALEALVRAMREGTAGQIS